MFNDTSVCGLILAGGKSRRMGGGDKTLRNLGGESLLERVISLAKPQVDQLVINANGDITRFSQFGITVIKDVIDDFPGPLAGVLTGMEWAQQNRPHSPDLHATQSTLPCGCSVAAPILVVLLT